AGVDYTMNNKNTIGIMANGNYNDIKGTNTSRNIIHNFNTDNTDSILKSDQTIKGHTNSFNLNLLNGLPCNKPYSITVTPTCGSTTCPPKSILVKFDCPPPVCPCAGNVTIDQSAVNITTQNNTSNANPVSTATTSFTLTSSMPVSEVRMLIEEFRLTTTAGNDNCILCRNKPQTWASINSATLSGAINQIPLSLPPAEKDMREWGWSLGPRGNTPTVLNNTLTLNLGIPGVTGLNCCTLKAEVCVKFIIRDAKCCETEVMKCFTFNLQ
ncbi:MAG: hypothetical protein ABJB05_17015, partial [Parafilimonas sp.]